MIRLEDITVAYDDRIILNHVNLDIHDGETLAVIGASGSGKSTTLRLIMGLQKPTSGRVYIDGEDITDYSEEKMDEVRRHMGMVFQYSALFDSMTVGENVAFGLRQHTKTKEEEIRKIVAEKLHAVGLDGIEEMMPNDLSGGMKKRVSLARAVALNPKIILYDEPTAGLDPVRSNDISRLIKAMQESMQPLSVVVTHDMESAFSVADRMVYLENGRFEMIGTTEEFKNTTNEKVRYFITGGKEGREGGER